MCVCVSVSVCVWTSAAVVACRFGEASRGAMPDSRSIWGPPLHTCLPRSGCWATGPELGLWACPAHRLRLAGGSVCERRDPQAPRAPAQRLASSGNATLLLRCCVCLRLREGAPSTLDPASLPIAQPSLSLSRPVLRSLLQCGSLAALVPDPCVARSLLFPTCPGLSQSYPNLPTISCALLSLPTRRLHSTACRIQGHIPPPTTTGDGSRRGAGLGFCAHKHIIINERASEARSG